ncbi:MAG: hypothetical protein M3P44_13445 [Actinomycetota bacterium]|nr:hypothetical protein [Actinomycetota bacterium]
MGYRIMGFAHAQAAWLRGRLTAEAGQGTVEYVALVLLVAGLMAGMVVAGRSLHGNGIDKAVADRIKDTIGTVGAK